jgi:membrane protein YdbS with pleckstrin-like domain
MMVAMAQQPGRAPETGWSAIRPVLVAMMVVVDAFAVISLAVVRPDQWWAPFTAFGVVLVGMVWLLVWSIRHRHDDD